MWLTRAFTSGLAGGSEATNDGVGVDDGRALVVAVAGGGVVADGDGLTAEGAGVSGLTADGSAFTVNVDGTACRCTASSV